MKNPKSLRTYGPGEKYFDLLNSILPRATPMGAYCVGLVSALGWQNGLDPNESVLHAAAECSTAIQAIEMYSEWEKLQRRRTC